MIRVLLIAIAAVGLLQLPPCAQADDSDMGVTSFVLARGKECKRDSVDPRVSLLGLGGR